MPRRAMFTLGIASLACLFSATALGAGGITLLANPAAERGKPIVVAADLTGDFADEGLTADKLVTVEWTINDRPLSESDFFPVGKHQRAIYLDSAAAEAYRIKATAGADATAELTIAVAGEVLAAEPPIPVERLPGAAAPLAPAPAESPNVVQFKEALRRRIVDIDLPRRDVRFDRNRLAVATALEQLNADPNLDIPAYNLQFANRMGAIYGREIAGIDANERWNRLFLNDAPALAAQFAIPYQNIEQLKAYYGHIAMVLQSDELKDAVFTGEIARFLAERGYTVVPSAAAAGRGPPRAYRHHRWLHRW